MLQGVVYQVVFEWEELTVLVCLSLTFFFNLDNFILFYDVEGDGILNLAGMLSCFEVILWLKIKVVKSEMI